MDDIDKKIRLVQELEQKKNCIEEAVLEAKSKKLALELLPETSSEYEKEKSQLFVAKRNLLNAVHEYEAKKQELENHCRINLLLPNYSESGLYWVEFFCMNN